MKTSRAVMVVLLVAVSVCGAAQAPSPFVGTASPPPQTQIDKLVLARLSALGIEPAEICSDAVFLRRAYLDVIGTLPTEQEARDFLEDKNPGKRAALVEHLLARDEFADYWAMKWSDVLRVKAEFPINLWPQAAQGYHRWIRTSIAENKPYDRFIRELLTSSGSNFRVPPVNFYRAMQNRAPVGIAQTVALTFMCERADKWPKERLTGMAAFFSHVRYKSTAEWKEEIVYFDPSPPEGKSDVQWPLSATLPDGKAVSLTADRDPREVFADWLLDPKNPCMARALVNRIWFWLFGRGIVHEPDDFRPDNPPVNPDLLAYLSRELVAAKYDMKHVYRLILNSRTYQLSSIPRSSRPEAAANFACYLLRRLDAEVLADALCQITGTTEKYTSAIPEPFTFMPEGERSIALPDGSITSAFLEMFGRPPRDTGLMSERSDRTTAAQRLHMLNSSHVQRKLEQGRKLQAIIQGRGSQREIVTRLYLTILSRFPTEEELKIAEAYAQNGPARGREAAIDLAWALINSAEFLYRH